MPSEKPTGPDGSFLARLNLFETLVLAAICLIAVAGILMVSKGMLLKAQAQFSHDSSIVSPAASQLA